MTYYILVRTYGSTYSVLPYGSSCQKYCKTPVKSRETVHTYPTPQNTDPTTHFPNSPTPISNRTISVVQRACVFALLEEDISLKEIVSITGLSASMVHQIRRVGVQVVATIQSQTQCPSNYRDKFFETAPLNWLNESSQQATDQGAPWTYLGRIAIDKRYLLSRHQEQG